MFPSSTTRLKAECKIFLTICRGSHSFLAISDAIIIPVLAQGYSAVLF